MNAPVLKTVPTSALGRSWLTASSINSRSKLRLVTGFQPISAPISQVKALGERTPVPTPPTPPFMPLHRIPPTEPSRSVYMVGVQWCSSNPLTDQAVGVDH